MSKSVLISIRKEHNDKIFAGLKKWEGRKTCPGNVEIKNYIDPTMPYSKSADDVKFFVYEQKTGGGCGKVIGEFVCDFAQTFHGMPDWKEIARALCVSVDFAFKYFNKGKGYMIRINAPKKYDTPKKLEEFKLLCPHRNQLSMDCERCRYSFFEPRKVTPSCGAVLRRPPQSWCYVEEI